MNTKLLRSTKDCTPIEIFLSVTSKPCPHPRTYKNRNAKPDVNCSMLVTTNILHIQWFNAMALFCRCCLLLPVFRKSVLCLSRVLGVLAWRAGYSSHGGRRYVVCSSRQRPAPFDWRRMLTHVYGRSCCQLAPARVMLLCGIPTVSTTQFPLTHTHLGAKQQAGTYTDA